MIREKCLGLYILVMSVAIKWLLLARVRFDNLHWPEPLDEPVFPVPEVDEGAGAELLEAGTPVDDEPDEPEPVPELLAEVILGPVVSTDESPAAI